MKAKKQGGKKAIKSIGTSVIPQPLTQHQQHAQPQQPSHALSSQSSLSISRNKHWKYISSYHGPWLQLPLELLESLYVINNDSVATPPPPIDPIIFGNLISIRRLVDEAADLSVRAASGISTTGGGPTRSSMSHTRQHRMRELAVNKLALAYRIDEIATAVVTMQSASAIDEVASRVLKKNATNLEALYVNFFHEKIPSR
ncbi:7050_t:CDS:1 [Acaulospora colombiana]|uniref:7050_t:CDS:1 n=1 Tax=Acaulospora colombiana TaxID=27376 RepID=A0ACA9LIZ7_9GLOM|nr:7050_t:CDS:1 [Acaulospora colombiana]